MLAREQVLRGLALGKLVKLPLHEAAVLPEEEDVVGELVVGPGKLGVARLGPLEKAGQFDILPRVLFEGSGQGLHLGFDVGAGQQHGEGVGRAGAWVGGGVDTRPQQAWILSCLFVHQ